MVEIHRRCAFSSCFPHSNFPHFSSAKVYKRSYRQFIEIVECVGPKRGLLYHIIMNESERIHYKNMLYIALYAAYYPLKVLPKQKLNANFSIRVYFPCTCFNASTLGTVRNIGWERYVPLICFYLTLNLP